MSSGLVQRAATTSISTRDQGYSIAATWAVARAGLRLWEAVLDSVDKFELQKHVNHLAKTYCQDRVKQARSYLKSIFDEAIEQEFLVKDPTRTLKIPKNLRPKDKQILIWEQMGAILAKAERRDRLWSARLELCQWIRENWTRRGYGTREEVPA